MPRPAGEPAIETILAFPSCGPGRYRPDPDGGCACALAFSTLLSSQGADAHHRRSLDLVRGNPANLPALPGVVNLLPKTCLAWSRVVHRAYPQLATRIPGMYSLGGVLLCPR